MSKQEVTDSVAQRITNKFLDQEDVKPNEIPARLTKQFK